MTLRILDRVQETTTSIGSAALNLAGTTTRMLSFSAAGVADGDTFYGLIEHATAVEWELAVCTYHSGSPNYITRAAPLGSSTGSTVEFSSGTKTVSLVVPSTELLAAMNQWQLKAANFTAVARGRYNVDTSSATVTATLPGTLADGDEFYFSDFAGTWDANNLIIDGAGALFADGGSRLVCDAPARFGIVVANGILTIR